MNILVTGGAGYIGSVLTEELVGQGHQVVVLDNLGRGHRAAVVPEAIFVQGDLGNRDSLEGVFQSHDIETVMHLAADTSVEQSMVEPGRFFSNNVTCGINLLECMVKYKVKRIIFSSSAAVYGQPKELLVTENHATNPVNTYGESKIMFERVLFWYGQAYGMSSIALRYFNVAGASSRFGQDHRPVTLLIPNVIRAASGQAEYIPIFGTDYDTRDGTCVRDYIHVIDIAHAHILALDYLRKNKTYKAYNLGNGEGYSVKEVVEAARRITGATIPVKTYPRRSGDPAQLVASSKLAELEMGWKPQRPELDDIIESAWQWQKEYPHGYNGE